jgi:peptide/nickel transport system substrate-binding protein
VKKNIFSSSTTRERVARLSLRGRVFFAISLALLIIGVCGALVSFSNRFTTEVPRFGGTYREGIVGVPRFINPVLANSDADHDLTSLVFSGLVRKGPDGSLIPDLAQEWSISPDGKTYTITLKPGSVFHDGTLLTPEDIIFTVTKIQDPSIKSPLRVAWDGVSVTSPDEQTVVFSLQKPYAGFLQQLTLGILSEKLWQRVPVDAWQTSVYNNEAIGTGPYMIKDISRNKSGVPQLFTLKAFSQFVLGKPYMKNVVIETFAKKTDAYEALANDSIDELAMVDSGDVDQTAPNSHTIITKSLPRVFGLFFNPSKNKLFADPALIKALNLATDKKSLIDHIFDGYGTPLSGPLPESLDSTASDFAAKQTLAKSLLDKAGWKINPTTGIREKTTSTTTGTGKKQTTQTSKQTLSFTLSTANTNDLEASAQLLAEQYKQIGVEVIVKVFEIGTLNENSIRGRDFEALLFGQVIKHDTDIFAFWHSSQKATPGLNITGYTNKQVDTLLESAIKETDHDKRFALYKKISDQLAADAPVVFLYTPDAIAIMSGRVRNPVMPPIATPSDRFSLIYQWYLYTDHVWNIFINH